jgi:hypothetical protein
MITRSGRQLPGKIRDLPKNPWRLQFEIRNAVPNAAAPEGRRTDTATAQWAEISKTWKCEQRKRRSDPILATSQQSTAQADERMYVQRDEASRLGKTISLGHRRLIPVTTVSRGGIGPAPENQEAKLDGRIT